MPVDEGPTTTTVDQLEARVAARPADPVARAALAAALHDHPGGRAHAERAAALIESSLRLGAVAPARAAAVALADAFPQERRFALLAAEATLHAGDRANARGRLESLAARHPDDPDVRLRLMALSLGDGDTPGALAWIEPVATASAEARAGYLQTLVAAGRHEEAREFAEGSVAVAPWSPELFQFLGVAELSGGDHDAAIDAFSEALRLAPDRPGAHYNLAIAFALRGSLAAAIGVVDAGLARDADNETLRGLREHIVARLNATDRA